MAATTVTTGPIRLRWVSAISSDVTDLLDRAARFDAEMGFGPPSRPGRSRSSGPTWVIEIETCLHRHGVSHDDDYVLAGALTVGDIASGIGVVELVVDPCRRSIGVATAVLEELGIEAAGAEGWAGTGLHRLHGVAYGSHPAAGRLARRYGASHTATRHHLVLPEDEGYRPDRSATSGGPATTTLNLEEGTARVRLAADDDPSEISDLTVHRVGGDGGRSSLAAVIAAAVAWLRERGATTVEALVDDAEDQLLLEAYRDQHFEHDRSDLTFRVG